MSLHKSSMAHAKSHSTLKSRINNPKNLFQELAGKCLAVTSNLSLDEILVQVFKALADFMPYDQWSFWIKDEYPQVIHQLQIIRDQNPQISFTVNEIHSNQGVGETFGQRLQTLSNHSACRSQKAAMVYPMRFQESWIGICHISREAHVPFQEQEYEMVELCMGYAALALENGHSNWLNFAKKTLELSSHHATRTKETTRLYEELEETYLGTVLTLVKAINARDAYTADHSLRLADWAEATARKLDCSSEEIQIIRWAAMLHDIGKIGVPDSILRKPGPLTEEEWVIMRTHPILGEEIISPVKHLKPVTSIIRSHQEKFDGSGYPDGLEGEQIPLAARIITVVDAFGAMTDERVYRKPRSQSEAAAELRRCAGTHFDERVVNVFFDVIGGQMIQ